MNKDQALIKELENLKEYAELRAPIRSGGDGKLEVVIIDYIIGANFFSELLNRFYSLLEETRLQKSRQSSKDAKIAEEKPILTARWDEIDQKPTLFDNQSRRLMDLGCTIHGNGQMITITLPIDGIQVSSEIGQK